QLRTSARSSPGRQAGCKLDTRVRDALRRLASRRRSTRLASASHSRQSLGHGVAAGSLPFRRSDYGSKEVYPITPIGGPFATYSFARERAHRLVLGEAAFIWSRRSRNHCRTGCSASTLARLLSSRRSSRSLNNSSVPSPSFRM